MARAQTPTGSSLVTGANGFAGSHLLDRLRDRGAVVGWDRPTVDITDRRQVRDALAAIRPSRLYHLAGEARVDSSWASVLPHLETNVLGTHHVLDAIRELGLDCRVLIVTSGMVYSIGDEPLTEDAPLVPASPYGVSKLAQDQLGLHAAVDDGLDVVVARPFNHIGPRQMPHFVVASFARQIALIEAGRADPVLRVGNLDAARDLTDVRDVVAAYEQLMERGVAGRAYNICTGRAVVIGDVLDALVQLATTTVQIAVDPSRLRPSDTPIILGNNDRIRREIGWDPSRDLRTTLADTLNWWRSEIQRPTFA